MQYLVLVDEGGHLLLDDPGQVGGRCNLRVHIDPKAWQPGMSAELVTHDPYAGETVVERSAEVSRGGAAVFTDVPGRNYRLRIRPRGPAIRKVTKERG